MLLKKKRMFMLCFFATSLLAQAKDDEFHIVRKGETLSYIAAKKLYGKIYGENGVLVKLIKLNPNIQDPNLIFEGELIVIKKFENHISDKPIIEPVFEEKSIPVGRQVSPDSIFFPKGNRHVATFSSRWSSTILNLKDFTTNSSARLYSRRDLEFFGTWSQRWDNYFQTFIEANFRNIAFQPSDNENKNLSKINQSTTGLRIGGTRFFSDTFSMNYSLGYRNTLFVKGLTSTSITLDSKYIPTINFEGTYEFYKHGNNLLGINADVGYLLGSSGDSYRVKSGIEYFSALYLKHVFPNAFLKFDLGYKSRSQDTSAIEIIENNVWGAISYIVPFSK